MFVITLLVKKFSAFIEPKPSLLHSQMPPLDLSCAGCI